MIWCVLVFWRFCRFDGAYTCYLLVPDKYIARLGGYLISVIAVHSQWRQRRPRAQSAQARADRAAHGARRLYAIHFLCRFISLPLCDALVSSCLVQVVVVGISSSVSELVTVMSDTHTHKRTRHSKSERDEEEKREKSSKAVTDCQLLTAAAEGEQKKKQAKHPLLSIS